MAGNDLYNKNRRDPDRSIKNTIKDKIVEGGQKFKKTLKNTSIEVALLAALGLGIGGYMGTKAEFKRAEKIPLAFSEIEAVEKQLEKNNEEYEEYIEFVSSELDNINIRNKEERARINLRLNKLMSQKKEYIKKNMPKNKDSEEQTIYEEERKRFDIQIESLQRDLDSVIIDERDRLIEFEAFINILQKAGSYYRKSNYVQKAKIFEILFLNITVDKKKRLTVAVKPGLESIFSDKIPSGGPTRKSSEPIVAQYSELLEEIYRFGNFGLYMAREGSLEIFHKYREK